MRQNNKILRPLSILFIFALVGIILAIRGHYLLSGIFGLYFVGYFIIRMHSLFDRPDWRLPDKAVQIAYFLAPIGFLLYLIHLVAGGK